MNSFYIRWPSLFKGLGGRVPSVSCHGHFLSHPSLYPTQKLPLARGVVGENSPAGKHSQLSNMKCQSMLPEWTNPKLFLQPYGHLGLPFRPLTMQSKGEQNNQRAFCRRSFPFFTCQFIYFMSCGDRVSQFEFI